MQNNMLQCIMHKIPRISMLQQWQNCLKNFINEAKFVILYAL